MSKFKIGDKVRIVGDEPDAPDSKVIEIVDRGPFTGWPRVAMHGVSHMIGLFKDRDLELVEEPNPFKSGDRIRVLTGFAKGRYGKVVTSYSNNGVSVVLDGTCGKSLYYAVDSVQYAPDQTFVLARGDRIVNNLTGRKGHVVEGQDEELWVVDETHAEETGAKAAAVEEYEQHYPNTYTITYTTTRKGPF